MLAYSVVALVFVIVKSLINPIIYAVRIPEIKAQFLQCSGASRRVPKEVVMVEGNGENILRNKPTSLRPHFLRGTDGTEPFLADRDNIRTEDCDV